MSILLIYLLRVCYKSYILRYELCLTRVADKSEYLKKEKVKKKTTEFVERMKRYRRKREQHKGKIGENEETRR